MGLNYNKILDYLGSNTNEQIADFLMSKVIITTYERFNKEGNFVCFRYNFPYYDMVNSKVESLFKTIKIDDISISFIPVSDGSSSFSSKKDKETQDKITLKTIELNTELKQSWEDTNIRSKLLPLIEKRRQELIRNSKKLGKSNNEYKDKLASYGKVLLDNGFKVSKVANFEYNNWDYYVTERKIPNKWHKYIEVAGKNIKFATVEVLLTKNNYKVGVKLETTGQIGCELVDMEIVISKIKEEYEIIKPLLEGL